MQRSVFTSGNRLTLPTAFHFPISTLAILVQSMRAVGHQDTLGSKPRVLEYQAGGVVGEHRDGDFRSLAGIRSRRSSVMKRLRGDDLLRVQPAGFSPRRESR